MAQFPIYVEKKKESMYGMLKGNEVNVVRIAPFSAFEFFFYDLYKNFFFEGVDASIPAKLAYGGLTGMTASFLTCPLGLIRTMLSVQVHDLNSKKPTILGTDKKYSNVME
jgi:solute carrier family 25 phosphate transporter 23/24/25/41